jgi:hypothetical protein
MMFASSYVEEEHHYWYWVTSGWITYILITQLVPTPPEVSLLMMQGGGETVHAHN